MSGFNNLTFTATSNGELNISSQNINGVPIVPVAPSTIGLVSQYAPLDSPILVGIPTAPTPDVSNNSTQIATTAYVRANRAELQANIDLKANIASPILTGIPEAPTPDVSNNSTRIATTAYVRANRAELQANIDLKADKTYVDASLNLKANITNVDASLNLKADKSVVDSSFARVAISFGVVDSSFARVATSFGVVDSSFSHVYTSKADKTYVDASLNLKANSASPIFTGIPEAPTALASVHTTQLATTEYVYNAINDLIDNAPGALDTLKEISLALASNEEEDSRILQLILDTIRNTDASFTSLNNLKADKSSVDNSLNLKADKSSVANSFALVDASFTQVNNSKADKSVVDASFANVYTSKADKSVVDASFGRVYTSFTHVDASFGRVYTSFTHVDASFAQVYTSKADKSVVDASFAQVYTSKADKSVVDASFAQVYTSKADKSMVDASFGQVYTSKADKSVVDASFAQVYTSKADKSVVDASFENVYTSKADKSVVDASFAQVYTSKADKSVVDASFAQVYTSKADKSVVDASFAHVDASFTNLIALLNSKANTSEVDSSFALVDSSFALVDASFAQVYTSKADKSSVATSFALVDASLNLVDASLNLKADDDNVVHINNYETITGKKHFRYQTTSNSDNGNEFVLFGGTTDLNNYDPTFVGIVGNYVQSSSATPSWNDCGMDIKSNAVRFHDPKSMVNKAMIDSTRGKFWGNEFCIENNNTVTNSENVESLKLTTTGLYSKNNLSISCPDASSNMTISSGNDMTISSKKNLSIYCTDSSSNMTISCADDITIDASQNIFIGTNSQGIIIGDYNVKRNGTTDIFPYTKAPGFLTIGKTKSSTQIGGYRYVNGSGVNTLVTNGDGNYSIVAADRIGCSELNAFSDLRLKENVGEIDISEAMNLVKNIKPVTFDWKDSKQPTSGFIAQDILKNGGPTHLVSTISQNDLEETVDSDNFVSPAGSKFVVNYNGFIPYYHKVIKNLVDRIEELEKKLI